MFIPKLTFLDPQKDVYGLSQKNLQEHAFTPSSNASAKESLAHSFISQKKNEAQKKN